MRISRLYAPLILGLMPLIGAERTALADQPTGTAADSNSNAAKSLPSGSFFSSLKQSFRQDFDRDVVRGHFDLGSPPNARRYYCMIDTRTNTKEPNGVLGDPAVRADGTTSLKNAFVSQYSCADAEREGILVTTGYVLGAAAATPPAPSPAQVQAPPPPAPPAAPSLASPPSPPPPLAPAVAAASPPVGTAMAPAPEGIRHTLNQIDVAGVRLGMSPDEVRAVLKSKNLLDYHETAESLSYLDGVQRVTRTLPNGRFVSVIAAWTPPPAGSTGSFEMDGESYEVMFTPEPGRERAMAIVHSMGYSPANAVREAALEHALIKKYGGFTQTSDLPESPTWRLQSGGTMQVGDPCGRRSTFGGLGGLNFSTRENLALKTTPDDFKSQVDRCGVAIVTEDHFTPNGGALREDRLITRYTVTAYSPSMGLEGSTAAAQLIHTAEGTLKKSAAGTLDKVSPSL